MILKQTGIIPPPAPLSDYSRYSRVFLESMVKFRPLGWLDDILAHTSFTSADGNTIFIRADIAAGLSEKYKAWTLQDKARQDRRDGPLWWKAYEGGKTRQALQKELENIFQFEKEAVSPLVATMRERALELLPEKASTCKQFQVINQVMYEFIHRLNTEDANTP